LSIIQIIPMGCSAHSTYMTLDTFERDTVTKVIHYEPIHAINVSTKILWESFEHSNFSLNISQLNKLPRISDLPIDDLMLNLQTANENTLLPDQSENAVWLYTGIAAVILIGGSFYFFWPELWLIVFVKMPIAELKATKRRIRRYHSWTCNRLFQFHSRRPQTHHQK